MAAKALLNQVIAETFDDSFSDPAFSAVKQAFNRVPEEASDYKMAQWYVDKISKAQASRVIVVPDLKPNPRSGSGEAPPASRRSETSEPNRSALKKPTAPVQETAGESKTAGSTEPSVLPESEDKKAPAEKAESKAMTSQKRAYDKVLKDFDKAQKMREVRLNAVMKEIDKVTESNRRKR